MVACECGHSVDTGAYNFCPSCGKPVPRSVAPAAMDMEVILEGARLAVKRLRIQEGVLGVVLVLCAWPLLMQAAGEGIAGESRLTPVVVGVGLLISGVVNVWLAFALQKGATWVARSHHWLSVFGLATGCIGLLLMTREALTQGSGGHVGDALPYVLVGMLLFAILTVPWRALLLLKRSDVRFHLGLNDVLDRQILVQELGRARVADRAVGTIGTGILGGVLGVILGAIVTLVLVILLIVSALNAFCSFFTDLHFPRC